LINKQFKEVLKSQVIIDYFNGKTRDEIATQNNTSTGNVSHILRNFEVKVGKLSVDETIEFARMVRKSGINMAKCLEGYRMYMLMDKLGLHTFDENIDRNKEFQDFVNEIYYPCKEVGIQPTWIFKWIKDLLNLCVKLKKIGPQDFISNNNSSTQDYANSFDNFIGASHERLTEKTQFEGDDDQMPLINCNSVKDAPISGTIEGEGRPFRPPNSKSSILSHFCAQELLLSDIINYISEAQNNVKKISAYHNNLKNELIKMKDNYIKLEHNLKKVKIEHEKILHFVSWYYRAKDLLWKSYNIRLETDLPKFIKVMNDFEKHNHDPYDIIIEYLQHQSLDKEIAIKNKLVSDKKRQIEKLEIQIVSTRARLDCNQTLEMAVEKLGSTEFEIADILRINDLIVEAASIKKIPIPLMVKIVVEDMEKNYYNGSLFREMVDKKRGEYIDLIKQCSCYKTEFEENYDFKLALSQLLNRGISQENIISLNLMILELEKRNFYAKNIQKNDLDKSMDSVAINMTNNYNALISDIKRYVTLAIACKEKQQELNQIKKLRKHYTYDKKALTLQSGKLFSYTVFTPYIIQYTPL
jgi:hypothetical protein